MTDYEMTTTSSEPRELTHGAHVEGQRATAEIQAALTLAYKRPRDETRAFNRIMTSCKRMKLAENALYSYSKGGTLVTGPSIRMAEVLATSWGNIDFGIKEVERRNGESVCIAYCWDLETNTRQAKEFRVPHIRDTKGGGKPITGERDIYELVANMGARRLRACILGIIPGDIVDAAVIECEKTLKGDTKEPIGDRVRKMVAAFAEHGVTQEMIEIRLGHKVSATNETELVTLRKIFTSIKDGMSGREQWFQVEATTTEETISFDKAKPAEKPAVIEAEVEPVAEPEPEKPKARKSNLKACDTLRLKITSARTDDALNQAFDAVDKAYADGDISEDEHAELNILTNEQRGKL